MKIQRRTTDFLGVGKLDEVDEAKKARTMKITWTLGDVYVGSDIGYVIPKMAEKLTF